MTRRSTSIPRKIIATSALCASLVASSNAASVAYSDSDFAGAWRTDRFSTAAGSSITHAIANAPSSSSAPSGNFIGLDVETDLLGGNVEGFSFDPVMQFNPGFTNSGISSILFGADVYRDGGVVVAFAIEQAGTHYFGQLPSANRLGSGWVSTSEELGDGDFTRFQDTLGNGGAQPDFSTSGAPITVGFYTQLSVSSNARVNPQQLTGAASFDNFSARINYDVMPVPEPSVALLAGVAGMIGLFRRHRCR